MATTIDSLLSRYRMSTMLVKIVVVNAVVFVGLRLAAIAGFFA